MAEIKWHREPEWKYWPPGFHSRHCSFRFVPKTKFNNVLLFNFALSECRRLLKTCLFTILESPWNLSMSTNHMQAKQILRMLGVLYCIVKKFDVGCWGHSNKSEICMLCLVFEFFGIGSSNLSKSHIPKYFGLCFAFYAGGAGSADFVRDVCSRSPGCVPSASTSIENIAHICRLCIKMKSNMKINVCKITLADKASLGHYFRVLKICFFSVHYFKAHVL